MARSSWHSLIALLLPVVGLAQGSRIGQVTEYEIKAAFLFNFAKFVEWPREAPQDSSNSIVIGVIGEDPFGTTLDKIVDGKQIRGRKLRVKRFRKLRDLEDCHILFISRSEKQRLPSIFNGLKNNDVLTVGEADWFADHGGIINLVTRDNKIQFQINLEASYRAGLRISSRLLRLAEIISDRYANRTREP